MYSSLLLLHKQGHRHHRNWETGSEHGTSVYSTQPFFPGYSGAIGFFLSLSRFSWWWGATVLIQRRRQMCPYDKGVSSMLELKLDHVSKRYEAKRWALQNVSLRWKKALSGWSGQMGQENHLIDHAGNLA